MTERIQQGAASLSGTIGDTVLRNAEGARLLGEALNREAAILGFNDAFRLIAFVALCAALFLVGAIIRAKRQNRRALLKGVQQ